MTTMADKITSHPLFLAAMERCEPIYPWLSVALMWLELPLIVVRGLWARHIEEARGLVLR